MVDSVDNDQEGGTAVRSEPQVRVHAYSRGEGGSGQIKAKMVTTQEGRAGSHPRSQLVFAQVSPSAISGKRGMQYEMGRKAKGVDCGRGLIVD